MKQLISFLVILVILLICASDSSAEFRWPWQKEEPQAKTPVAATPAKPVPIKKEKSTPAPVGNYPELARAVSDVAKSDKALVLNLYEQLAEQYRRFGQNEKVESLYQEALKTVGDHETILVRLADLAKQKQDTPRAVDYLDRAIKMNPSNLWLYQELARLSEQLGDPQKAEDSLEKAIEKTEDPTAKQELQRNLVQLQIKSGKKEEVIASYQKEIENNPKDLGNYIMLAQAYQDEGSLQEAVGVYEKAYQQFPKDPTVLQRLGELYWARGNYDHAQKMMHVLAQVDPGSEIPWRRIAEMHAAQGKWNEAANLYAQLVEKFPNNLQFKVALVDALIQLKEYETVRTQLAQLEKSATDPWLVNEVKRRIEYLASLPKEEERSKEEKAQPPEKHEKRRKR